MLKLEKIRKTKDLNVCLRQKEPFFNRTFCLALLWAAGLHLFGILAFHIAPFKITYSNSLFPPVSVDSDLGWSLRGKTMAFFEEEINVPAHLLVPFIDDFVPAPVELPALKEKSGYAPKISGAHPFLSSELKGLQHEASPLQRTSAQFVHIDVSGPLAAAVWKKPEIEISSLHFTKKSELFLCFDVLVDGKSGRIFWLQPAEKAPLALLAWAEKIMKGMEFDVPSVELAIAGRVEISIRPANSTGRK